jgi:hypothetical protein
LDRGQLQVAVKVRVAENFERGLDLVGHVIAFVGKKLAAGHCGLIPDFQVKSNTSSPDP